MSEYNSERECDPELEAELRMLRPANAPGRIAEAIARELAQVQGEERSSGRGANMQALAVRTPGSGVLVKEPAQVREAGAWWQRLMWAGGGAAIAAVVLLITQPATLTTPKTEAIPGGVAHQEDAADESTLFEPVESAREVIATEDGGVIYDDATGASQIVRYSSMERHSWANAAGALVEVEVPRVDLLMIPVSYQ